MQFIDLKRQYLELKEKINSGIQDVLNHGKYIMGPEVFTLEQNLSKFTDSKYVVSCSSGTDALLMALMSLGVKSGDYIITSPFTYIATSEVMSLLGAIPKFVDIDPKTFNIDIEKLELEINKAPDKYKVIMPVNIFGLPANFTDLDDLKKKFNLVVIEDAAQSFGASINKKLSCSFGDIGCTSFFPAKPLGCYGDGGAIFTDNEEISDTLKSIRVHGTGSDKYDNVRVGINGRLDTIQAAILIPKLEVFSKEIELRNIVANNYSKRLNNSFELQEIPEGYISSWAQYSILCDSKEHRDTIIKKLDTKNIPSAIYYRIPLHLQKVYSYLNYQKGDFPISEDVSSRIISLPMHPYLTQDETELICDVILGE